VDASEDVREERLVRDRGLERDEARRMIAAQMPSEAKRARADFVISNTGSPADLRREANRVWDRLLGRAGERADG
ncbi:MAG: dephospho-CoA kinase, partial [Gemmatimonadota bacterium]|nr:dephospho-CoA kinase [Gemmatimonadota bacterium]